MAKRQSVTSVGISPEQERKSRFLKYTIAMVIRVICIVLAVWVPLGWFTLIFALGAIFLPYFAVVIANEYGTEQVDKAPKIQAPTLSISADQFVKTKEADDQQD